MKRRSVLAVLACSGLAYLMPIQASAQVAPAPGISVQGTPIQGGKVSGDAEQPLRRLYTVLEKVMRSGQQTPFTRRFDLVTPVIEQVFDFETVLKASIGTRWEGMSAEAKAHLLQVYRRFTAATYVANFDKYDGEQFRILSGSRDSGRDRVVGTEIVSSNGDRQRLDYLMRDENGGWRIVDVLLDGTISRVAVQRSDFRKILTNGDAETLIATLKRKITDLSGGALSS